ncbi:unnamed protein product [Schistosoma margrebowiei]|uniref:Uncharacterized protein n=1 Tax=Schistosoma margrebowiei TaxID=48269 RepID=A0A183M2X6_9TREM|nr:unnamed protein product [Schistosoma margrebowiei]
MWQTGKTSQIAMEMRRYNLAVLGISETHWTQAGQKGLATGEMLLYSSHEEDNAPHTQGVALMLSKVARNALVLWESHGSRIIKASFKTKRKGITMNIIQCFLHPPMIATTTLKINSIVYTRTNADKDSQCSRSLCISRLQHIQGEKQGPQIQHREQQSNHS